MSQRAPNGVVVVRDVIPTVRPPRGLGREAAMRRERFGVTLWRHALTCFAVSLVCCIGAMPGDSPLWAASVTALSFCVCLALEAWADRFRGE